MAKPSLEVFIGANTDGFTKGLKTVEKQSQQFGNNIDKNTKQTDQFGAAMGKVGGIIAGAFAVGAVVNFGKQVIDITAEFQKFEAVLTNTLGSKSAAQIALNQIQDFASKTPYSVAELTSSFVKLANQGFKPTMEEMRKLGDVAASTGKTFDMLAEAIIDAQTGEFERLKEFGIRAQKEGDKVMFTFKGVKTEADFSADAIRGYVLSLGDAVGVSGSMAAISATLGGQISNLGDSWDNLLKTIGDGTTGVMASTIATLNKSIGLLTVLLQDEQKAAEKFFQTYGVGQAKLIAMAMEEYKTRIANGEQIEDQTQFLLDYGERLRQNQEQLQSYRDAAQATFEAEKKAIEAASAAAKAHAEALRKVGEEIKFAPNLTGDQNVDFSTLSNEYKAEGAADPTGMAHLGELGAPEQESQLFGVNEQLLLARENWALMNEEMIRTQEYALMVQTAFADTFGQLFADLITGETAWKDFGKVATKAIVGVINKLLAQAIAAAIAGEAPKGLIGVITGSAAAVGISALFNSKVPAFADGGIVSGQTLGVMGEYSGAKSNPEVIAPLDKLQGLMKNMGGNQVVVMGETRISGRDLVVVLQNEERFTSRTN